MSKIQTNKIVYFMIPIPNFLLKKCLRPIWYFKFKAISLATHDDMEFVLVLEGPF